MWTMTWTLIAILNFGTPTAHKMIIETGITSFEKCLKASVVYLRKSQSNTATTCVPLKSGSA